MESKTIIPDNHIQKLLAMDEKEFFAESVMFMLGKMIGLAKGKTAPAEYRQSKTLVEGMGQIRKLTQYLNQSLPQYPERGWMFPYLLKGDRVFGSGRWDWWTDCLLNEKIEGPIPQIEFRLNSCDKEVQETILHIEKILGKLESTMGISSSLMTLVQWVLWAFGSHSIKQRQWSEKTDRFLYEKFELGRLQATPFDYFAWLAQQSRGNGRWANPNHFYQTPPTVSQAMAQMLFADSKNITASICDPCAGTGTLLLFASNFSVNLHGADIAWDLCAMCEANGFLYMPSLVKPAPWLAENRAKAIPEKGTKPTPGRRRIIIDDKPVDFHEKNGQLLLFEV